MPNIYEHIQANKRDTFVIVALFVAVVALIGWLVGQLYDPASSSFYAGMALIFSGVSGFFSYYNSDKIVLAISNAKKVEFNDSPYLHNLVDNLCIASGLPKPRIYVIDDTAMNAFATGRDPEHAVICFTTGIVEKLEKRELEGVIAHELSHIQNYDIRLMSIVSVLVGSITLLSDWLTRGIFYGGGRRRDRDDSGLGGLLMLLGIVLVVLSPIIATLIQLAVSRRREFLADSSGALLTRYPDALASALRKISADPEVLEAANGATAHLYFANPLKGQAIANLFKTHPPVEERIRRLQEM